MKVLLAPLFFKSRMCKHCARLFYRKNPGSWTGIGALRSEIRRASEQGDLIDPRYPQRVLDEVLRLERADTKVRRIAGWVAAAMGSIPVPGLGIAAAATAEAIGIALDKRRTRPWRWFYLISDGRGAT